MRRLVAGIFAAFALLTAVTVYLAAKNHDGLVDRNYYRSATGFLSAKEREESVGLVVRAPDRFARGRDRVKIDISTAAGPLRGARVTLEAMRISGDRYDRAFPLREEAPGRYVADVDLPLPGQWLLNLDVECETVRTAKRWFATVAGIPHDGAR